jgi:diguanylate cyclase (GGDEF)-like protein
LRTRVGKRVLALFITCALLPVGAAVGLFYTRVQSSLTTERLNQLGHAAESYGTLLIERLDLADRLVRAFAIEGASSDAATSLLERYFRTVIVEQRGRLPRTLLGEGTTAPTLGHKDETHHLASGESIVTIAHGAGGPSVWLVRATGASLKSLVYAELQPAYLWGSEDDLPYLTSVCVLDGRRAVLHCTKALPAGALDTLREQLVLRPSGRLDWTESDERHFSSYREIFLHAKFRAESWPIVISQPADEALAPTRAIAQIIVPVIALGALIAAFLGLIQIRRILGPLAQLTHATQRIAARDFSTRVALAGDDEFGALGRALDSMAARLGRQFHALGVLAEIDTILLSKVDMARVANMLGRRMGEISEARWQALLLAADPDAPGLFEAHACGEGENVTETVVELTVAQIEHLSRSDGGLTLHLDEREHPAARTLFELGAQSVFALPIALGEGLAGVLLLGYPATRGASADELGLLRDLRDRIAVALATAARENELYRSANYDPLTRLPNRGLFMTELSRELSRAERQGRMLGLLFIDLDGFSHVNDSLGHAVGDELLVHASTRLRLSVRKSDLLARLGGDEFTVLLLDLHDVGEAVTVAKHVIETLSKSYDVGHGETFIGASVGIAMFPTNGTTPQELLRHADLAMYRAKGKGRGNHVLYEDEMNHEAQRRLALDRELRHALANDQFVLHYQPQLHLGTNRIVGAEALLRWQHPQRGLVSPAHFVSFAEETGQIEQIGDWALRTAAAQFVAWKAQGLPIDHISVNVSPRQFRQKDFAARVARAIEDTGISPRELRLEITESVLLDNEDSAAATLERLRELGTPLELDDFGTGYSSLAYLQHLPVSTIKLDRSFIRDVARNRNAQAVVRAAISMVHALNKQILVEGVELPEQAALLRSWGCDAVQGFHVSKPLAPAQFAAFVDEHDYTNRVARRGLGRLAVAS